MRRFLIGFLLPLLFCTLPLLAAGLIVVAIPERAKEFYIEKFELMDALIVSLGSLLFLAQMIMCWRALRWHADGFREGADRWINNLSQAAEWFPMLGLIGTVGGILQTFSSFAGTQTVAPSTIISRYAPAITATGSGLFMAFINILPAWIVLVGRDLIKTLGGATVPPPEEAA